MLFKYSCGILWMLFKDGALKQIAGKLRAKTPVSIHCNNWILE